jgi:ferredoxin
MQRSIIKIDEDKCNGCGLCILNCHEGALQIIDGKARLISDLFCDGLGACIGHCPERAITIEERQAEPYNETLVMQEMIKKGKNTVLAHLKHLKDHGADDFLNEAIKYIKDNNIDFNINNAENEKHVNQGKYQPKSGEILPHPLIPKNFESNVCGGGCPGSKVIDFSNIVAPDSTEIDTSVSQPAQSQLRQWPVQLHLLNPNAPYFKNSDLLLAADCTAFSMGGFHNEYLKGKILAIACPKLDSNKESYIEKIAAMIEHSKLNTITVMMMEVPCCSGLMQIAKSAISKSGRKIPVKQVILGIQGNVLSEEWV